MTIDELRKHYHAEICRRIIRIKKGGTKKLEYPNFADSGNKSSVQIAWGIVELLKCPRNYATVKEQTIGDLFEEVTRDFIERVFGLLHHLRPGQWQHTIKQTTISRFYQYEHLAQLTRLVKRDKTLSSVLGRDYIVKPDIVISRAPLPDEEINRSGALVSKKGNGVRLTPLREATQQKVRPVLHASISCKWTIRSDRAQNTRTEALNLIRNRKGHLPHIVAVTGEPLPTRIAALALGTGDLDCVYHFALPELQKALKAIGNEDQLDMLAQMIEGRRLRDISDLPFDLIA